MSDWADERAELLWSLDSWKSDLADELRKAKASGMREAVKMCLKHISWMNSDHHGPQDAVTEITILAGIIKVAADKIEKGESND